MVLFSHTKKEKTPINANKKRLCKGSNTAQLTNYWLARANQAQSRAVSHPLFVLVTTEMCVRGEGDSTHKRQGQEVHKKEREQAILPKKKPKPKKEPTQQTQWLCTTPNGHGAMRPTHVYVATNILVVWVSSILVVCDLPCLEYFRGHSDLGTAGRKETQCRDQCEETKPQWAPSCFTGAVVPFLKIAKVLILSIVV